MKTLKLNLIAFVVLFVSTLQSCIFVNGESGSVSPISNNSSPRNPASDSFKLTDFDGLDMGSAFVVNVTRANTYSVVAKGDVTDLNDLDIYVNKSGDLVARYSNWRVHRYRMEINITMPTLVYANFSGATDVFIEKFNNLNALDLNASGASKVVFDGNITKTTFDISGASSVRLTGAGNNMTGQLSGASKLEAGDFLVFDADVNLSGASFARVNANKSLRVSASGASSLRYKGSPADIRQNLSGSSSVRAD